CSRSLRVLPSFPTRRSSDLFLPVEFFPMQFFAMQFLLVEFLLVAFALVRCRRVRGLLGCLRGLRKRLCRKEHGRTGQRQGKEFPDRKSTRLNSSHVKISYAV